MTKVATHIERIFELEGFRIRIIDREGNVVDEGTSGLPAYEGNTRKLKGSATVAEWQRSRFADVYKGYQCQVLKADGSVAVGQTKLETVRSTYKK
jgi:hypothetical protein